MTRLYGARNFTIALRAGGGGEEVVLVSLGRYMEGRRMKYLRSSRVTTTHKSHCTSRTGGSRLLMPIPIHQQHSKKKKKLEFFLCTVF